jgi:nitrate reductase NapE component
VARNFIEKRLEVSLFVFLAVVVLGVVAVKYLF